MEFLRMDEAPALRSPTMIAAFGGWNDAAEVATGVVNHLVSAWSAQPFATIEPDDFYDFTQTRPQVKMVNPHERRIDWPANTFYAHKDPAGRRDAVLLVGVEPQLKWRTFTSGILDVAQRCGVINLICIGGLLAEVTHTRPPRISGSGTTPELLAQVRGIGIEGSRYEGPTGIVGVLHDACRAADLRSVSLWSAVPHYVSLAPSPRAAKALCVRLSDLMGVPIPTVELDEAEEEYSSQVSEAVASDPETQAYVEELEQRADSLESIAEEGQLPSGDALADELTRFLRDRDRGRDLPPEP